MSHDWLLVETLGNEPVVVARGRQLKNMVPISAYLRRNPNLSAIQTAVAETVASGQSLASITSKSDRVIRTEPVKMSDGRVHGVHVWSGPADAEPPERPVPGPLKWDLTIGVATDTAESLANSGMDPAVEATHGRAFADDLPTRDLNPSETKVLALTIKAEPGQTMCTSWDVTDHEGNPIKVGFVARIGLEAALDGSDHLVSRAMNWRGELEEPAQPSDYLAQRILNGLAQPGLHRALVDLNNWALLKWLDEPCPYYDWRGSESDLPQVNPEDAPAMAAMTSEFADGPTHRVLRLRGHGGGWVPMHVTVNRVELDEGTYAGLVSLRLPTDAEVAEARLVDAEDHAS
jgi:Family of unknown function (DUF5628)/Domain of unknown function (DUF5593)